MSRRTAIVALLCVVTAAAMAGPAADAATSAVSVAKRALGLSNKANTRSKQALARASKPGPAGDRGPTGDQGPAGNRGAAGQGGNAGTPGQDGVDYGPATGRYVAVDPNPDTVIPSATSASYVTLIDLSQANGPGSPLVTQFGSRVIAKAVLNLENQDPVALPSDAVVPDCLLEIGSAGSYQLIHEAFQVDQNPVGFPEQLVVAGAITRPPGTYDVRVRCANIAGSGKPDMHFKLGDLSVWAVRQ